MSGFARIESIEALRELRTFLCTLASKISTAIDEADFEIVNTANQLRLERLPYWQKELRIRGEKLIAAQLELKRKQFYENSSIGGNQSLIDEKKALALAQNRFDEAEEKLRKIKAFMPKLEKEGYECRGVLQGLANFAHIDIPNRRTQIDQMICSLESYVNLAAPVAADAPFDSVSTSGNMGKAMPSPLSDMEQLCKKLRQKNPLRDITLSFPAGKPALNLFGKFTLGSEILEKLKDAKKNTPSFSDTDKLAFDHLIENSSSIYIERTTSVADKEIKLFIGSVSLDNTVANYLTCTIADFLKEYPILKDIISLPEKWLAVLESNTVKAIFNADDKLV